MTFKQHYEELFTVHERKLLMQVVRDELELDWVPDDTISKLYTLYADSMPYGVAKARTGDPFVWLTHALQYDLLNMYKEKDYDAA